MSHESSSVQAIELEAGNRITIDSIPNSHTLQKCHSQEQSLLFTLPLELRETVWMFALHDYTEPSAEIAENADLSGQQSQSYTSLLLTCRRIWLEANAISFPAAGHRSWHTGGETQNKNLIEKLTILNRSRIEGLHVILEGCWISFSKDYILEELPLWPRKLIITILAWPWEMVPGTRELGTYIHIYVRDLLLDDSTRETQQVEFHLEERVEQTQSSLSRRQLGETRMHYIQRRNLDTRSDQEMDDITKYWELQPVDSEPCRHWTRHIPEHRMMRPADPRSVDYLTYKFTWKRIAAFPDDYCSTASAGHTARRRPPSAPENGDAENAQSVVDLTTNVTKDEQCKRRWEIRWREERSLLKFAT